MSCGPRLAGAVTFLSMSAETAMPPIVHRGLNAAGQGPIMNKRHLETLSSPRWAQLLEQDLLPWVDSVADLGDDVLEIGPGPGLTTDLLRARTARLTAVEIDPTLAAKLADRLAGTNVEVINGNAADTGFPDG